MSQDRNIAPDSAFGREARASTSMVREMLKRRELRVPREPDEAEAVAVMDRLGCGDHAGCGGRYLYVPIGDGQCAVRLQPQISAGRGAQGGA